MKQHTASGATGLRFARVWQGMAWAMVTIVAWLSLTPHPPTPPAFLAWDKAQHFAAYGGLMYWYAMGFARHWRWPLFLLGLGIALEIAQGMGGVRQFDYWDMAANAVGVGAGLALSRTPAGRWLAILDRHLGAGRPE